MSEELVRKDEIVEIEGIKIKREQVELIKRTIFIGATDDELRLFFYECARRGTHPMDRLIFPVVRKDKDGNRRVTFQTGIDYLRAAAEETARYVGQKSVQLGPVIKQKSEDGEIDAPEWAEVIVLRKDSETGEVNETPFRAHWKEFYPGEKQGFMWRKMPNLMLSKCAEAGALRKGFPRKLGGLYINEEMEQAEAVPFGNVPNKPTIKEPQKKSNGQSQTQTTEGKNPTLKSSILDVKTKNGKKSDGTPWTLFWIYAHKDGNETSFSTFSKTHGELAQSEKGTGVMFEFEYQIVEKDQKKFLELINLTKLEQGPGTDEDIPF